VSRPGRDQLQARVRFHEAIHRILAEHASPAELGLSVALGVFVACTPFYGLQTVLALGLAWALHLNRIAAVLAAQVSIAPVSPFLVFTSVQLGEHLLHGHFFPLDLAVLRAQTLTQLGGRFFTAWLLGGCVLGCALGALLGGAVFVVAQRRRGQPPPP
jgi:uncharacterized protein